MPSSIYSNPYPSNLAFLGHPTLPTSLTETSTAPAGVDSFKRRGAMTSSNTFPTMTGPTPPAELHHPRASLKATRIPELGPELHAKLIRLSDPDTVTGIKDFAERVEEISRIFIAAGDPRGAFPALYKVITHRAHASIDAQSYGDNAWASKLVTDFGDLYLKNLHAHLTGGNVSPGWQRYYTLAANPNASLERLVSVGATVHLVVDLPNSLARIGTPTERQEDFMHFGDILLHGYEEMLEAAKAGHGIDMSEIFGLFVFGDIADAHHGEGTATRFGFQTIRRKAWLLGQMLQDGRRLLGRAEIAISWRTIDGVLAGLDRKQIL